MAEVFKFDVWLAGWWWSEAHPATINAETAGKAKVEYLRELDGCCGDDREVFLRLRARKVGRAVDPPGFAHAIGTVRGMTDVHCGDRVRHTYDGREGVIVGHVNANLEVLFDDGQRTPVHPGECGFTGCQQTRASRTRVAPAAARVSESARA